MGNTQDKHVDNTGEVTNTIIVDTVDVQSERIETILIILTATVGCSFAYQLYKDYRRSIKKKIHRKSLTIDINYIAILS